MCGFDNASQKVSYRFFRSQLQMLRNKLGKEGGWGVDYNQKASARLVENYC